MGDPQTNVYTKSNKKTFLFTFLGETVGLIALYAYFLCVVTAYKSAMHGPEKEEEPAAEKKSSEKEASEKKEDEPAMDEAAE